VFVWLVLEKIVQVHIHFYFKLSFSTSIKQHNFKKGGGATLFSSPFANSGKLKNQTRKKKRNKKTKPKPNDERLCFLLHQTRGRSQLHI